MGFLSISKLLFLRHKQMAYVSIRAMSHGNIPTEPRAAHFPIKTNSMLPKNTFEGKIALVTGGGTGLGRSLVTQLIHLGANAVISSRKADVLERAVQEISQECHCSPDRLLAASADVRDAAAVERVLDMCVEKFGNIPNLIVNNAAGNFISPSERLSSNAFKTIIDIVLNGSANVTLATAKRLIAAEQAAVFLSITTFYADTGSGFVLPSACAKAGVECMTKSLAAEWGRYGLRFNALAPGPIYTEGAFSRIDPSGMFIKEAVRGIPAGRIGHVSEFVNLATYLLSDYSSWINGTVVRFDGGELNSLSGEFNRLNEVSSDQWDALETLIRKVKHS